MMTCQIDKVTHRNPVLLLLFTHGSLLPVKIGRRNEFFKTNFEFIMEVCKVDRSIQSAQNLDLFL
jgi:hypothetical protein